MALDAVIVEYRLELDEVKKQFAQLKNESINVGKVVDKSAKNSTAKWKQASVSIDSTSRATKNLGANLNKTGAEFEAVSKKGQKVRLGLKDVEEKSVKPLSSAFSVLRNKIVAALGVGVLINFGIEAVKMAAKMEGITTQLKFITGSSEQGAESFEKIRILSNELGLELLSTADAYTKFAGAATKSGLALSEVDRIFENVAIASKAMNLSAEDTSGVFLALQQMISKGTVAAEELRGQLAERLPGAFSLAAKSMGVMEQDLNKMLEQGKVISREFLPQFSEQLRSTFEGAMGDATVSLTSNLNRMSNAWSEFKISTGNFLSPIVLGIAKTMEDIQNLVDKGFLTTVELSQKRIEETKFYGEYFTRIRESRDMSMSYFKSQIAGYATLEYKIEAAKQIISEYTKMQSDLAKSSDGNRKADSIGQKEALEQMKSWISVTEQKMNADILSASYVKLSIEQLELLAEKGDASAKKELKRREDIGKGIEKEARLVKDNVRDVQEYVEKLNKIYEMSGTNAIDYWKSPQDVMKEQVDNAEAVVDWVNKIISSYEKAGVNLIEYNTEIDKSSENIEGLIGWIEKQQEAMRYAGVEIVEYAQIPLSPEEELDKAISDWQNYAGAVFSVIDSITGYFSQQSDYRETILESELESGRISQEEYDKKTAELRKKQAEKEKLLAIFQVLVNTPPAIMKATADLGIPGAVLATIAAAVQLATALSLDVPKFAKGVIDLQGAGTGTSDSITAKVSKGESVMTAKETRTYKPVLKAIRDGNFEEYIYGNYLKKIEAKRQKQQTGYDDYRLWLAVKQGSSTFKQVGNQITNAIREQRKPHRF